MESLLKGNRYLFYYNQSEYTHIQETFFRASFLDILEIRGYNKKTLRVYGYQDSKNNESNQCIHTLPIEWVTHANTLEEIVKEQLLFPSEIVLEIDGFY
jgi:hypothetical protein